MCSLPPNINCFNTSLIPRPASLPLEPGYEAISIQYVNKTEGKKHIAKYIISQ